MFFAPPNPIRPALRFAHKPPLPPEGTLIKIKETDRLEVREKISIEEELEEGLEAVHGLLSNMAVLDHIKSAKANALNRWVP